MIICDTESMNTVYKYVEIELTKVVVSTDF